MRSEYFKEYTKTMNRTGTETSRRQRRRSETPVDGSSIAPPAVAAGEREVTDPECG
jgi:hypothetical protein